jgi:hypothetical protein
LTVFAFDGTTGSAILHWPQTITANVVVAMGLIRAAITNLTTECSTAVCVGLHFAIATGEISARRFLVAAITSTTCALATSMIVAHMLQVASTTRETFASFFLFAAISDVAGSTATAILAADLNEVGWARVIVATCLQCGGCCGCGCGCGGRGVWAFCVPGLTTCALICATHNLCEVAHIIVKSVTRSVEVCESHAIQGFLTRPLASLTIQLETTVFGTILVFAFECFLLETLQR